MTGLALEGGGARGAFHMGAVKALLEAGITFDGIVGTSIGAINGAIIAQGDFDIAMDWWQNIKTSELFDVDDEAVLKIAKGKLDMELVERARLFLVDTVQNKGLDTSRMRTILNEMIHETRLRESKIDFGLVTVSASDMKSLELFKEDIPKGKMVDYIMASASLPVFRPKPMDGKVYLDGGLYDNCPVNMLMRKGYRHAYAVRTMALGRTRPIFSDKIQVTSIYPSEDLGPILLFDGPSLQRQITLGYLDAKRVIHHLCGIRYYLTDCISDETAVSMLSNLSDEALRVLATDMNMKDMPPRRFLFEGLLPHMARQLGLSKTAGYGEIMLGALEYIAMERNVDKYRLYTAPEFVDAVRRVPPAKITSVGNGGTSFGLLEEIAKTVSDILPATISDKLLRKAGRMFLDLF